jgi:uncharacterized protein
MNFRAFLTGTAAFALLALDASAQSFVWKITRNGQTLYLGGTVHVLRESDFPLPIEFDDAFAAADELWFEVDFAEMQSPAAIGLLLRDRAALVDYCRTSGLSLATMSRFKPGLLMMNIQMFEFTRLGLHQQGVELYYGPKAMRAGKPTRGLETIAEQLGFIEAVGTENPSELVLQTIRDLQKTGPMIDTAIDAWRRGDLAKMNESILQQMEADAPAVAEKLIAQRNRNWVPQIERLLASEPVELILVGAGHLPGPKGVLALLEARGCAIEQIVAAK